MNSRIGLLLRNLLITIAMFWLSRQTVVPFTLLFGWLGSGVAYHGALESIAMGAITSMGRAVSATLAGAVVTLAVSSRRPERWGLVIAALYLVKPPTWHWHQPPSISDSLWQGANILWPVFACSVVTVLAGRWRFTSSERKCRNMSWVLAGLLAVVTIGSLAWYELAIHSNVTPRVTVEDVKKQLAANAPIGTSRAAVESYLSSQSIPHSFVDSPKYPNERRVEMALFQNTARSWMVRGDIQIRFQFDESDKLLSYSVREVFTGP